VVVGTSASYGDGGNDVLLAKYSSAGALSWSHTWGGTGGEIGASVDVTSDNGFVVTGQTSTYAAAGVTDVFIGKYDASGNIGGCTSPNCQSVTPSAADQTITNGTGNTTLTPQTVTDASTNLFTGGLGQSEGVIYASPPGVGNPLATQNKALDLTSLTPITLRVAISVDNSGFNVSDSNLQLKLQFAPLIGANSCSALSSGSYSDVTSTSALQFYDDSRYSDGQAITTDPSDPSDGSRAMQPQSYEESNNFTNSQSALYAGQDGIWQFALTIDNSTLKGRAFCIRVATSGGTQLTAANIAEVANSTQSFQRLRQGNWWDQEGKRQYINL
jgi:hypothetical protein